MKRREFLTGTFGTLGTGAACSAFGSTGAAGAPMVSVSREMRVEPGAKFVAEPARQVPVAAEVDVLVAGGGPAGAHGVYRVTGTCMGMGQAAGLAAATAAARNASPADLDGKDLHHMLVERGARFEPRR